MNAELDGQEWQMGGSVDARFAATYGITEADVAMLAVDAMFYAQAKAGGSKSRFVTELVIELEATLAERMGLSSQDH